MQRFPICHGNGLSLIQSGRHKKIIIVGADKMSSIVNYADRTTAPIFGDGAAACMIEATTEEYGFVGSMLRTDGKGLPFLHIKAGGSVCPPSYYTIDNKMHYIHQEGRTVFKYAVSNMSDAVMQIAAKYGLDKNNIRWIVPHQANLRIIEAVASRLEVSLDKVMVNIQRYGNTSAATLPLCLWVLHLVYVRPVIAVSYRKAGFINVVYVYFTDIAAQ